MQTLKNRLEDVNPFEDVQEFSSIMDEYESYYREHLTDEAISDGVAMVSEADRALVTKSTREGVKYQVTFFDEDHEPISHKELDEINYRDIPLGYEIVNKLK